MTATLTGLSEDARDLLAVLADAQTHTQRNIAFALYGPFGWHTGIRKVQAATQELRLAGWPVVSDGEGMALATDPAAVRLCADALGKRLATQYRTVRALRRTASEMGQPLRLWEQAG